MTDGQVFVQNDERGGGGFESLRVSVGNSGPGACENLNLRNGMHFSVQHEDVRGRLVEKTCTR